MSDESTALVTAPQTGDLSRQQVDLLKQTVCKGATDAELKFFLEVCKVKRLDPFSGHIHAVKRKERGVEKMTHQVGIDGFRLIAERTGQRDGEDAPEWCGTDGAWTTVWLKREHPAACRVRVYRKGHGRPYVGLAYWDFYAQEYDGKPNRMWAKGGPNMIAKCAEALALRKAFPEELSGVFSQEEMHQAAPEYVTVTSSRDTVVDAEYTQVEPDEFKRPFTEEQLAWWTQKIQLAGSVSQAALRELVASDDMKQMPEHQRRELRPVIATVNRQAAQRDAQRISAGLPPGASTGDGGAATEATSAPAVDGGA